MIVEHIQPPGRLMALSAIRPILSLVVVNLRMAGVTILGRALINIIHMTGTASGGLMRIGQHERSLGMIKSHILPAAGVMAARAVLSELTLVLVLGGMAVETSRGCILKITVQMTCFTCHGRMQPGQWETCHTVIESYILPTAGTVTQFAVRAKHPLVIILLCMTGITSGGCALKDSIHMTGCTHSIGMQSC